MSPSPSVAVAVVSWNTRGDLSACLQSLEEHAHAGRAEVWVVDNASTDGSAAMVRRRFGWAELIASEENVGYGAAVNLIAARTDTPWIAAANADVQVWDGALQALLDAGQREPGAGAIAPRLVLPERNQELSVQAFPTVRCALVAALGLQRVVPGLGERLLLPPHWYTEGGRGVDWALGSFLLLRRSAFDAVGGFDERQWMFAEDIDLCWRLREAGWITWYEPRATVTHRSGAATTKAWGEDRDLRGIRSVYAWMVRRRGLAHTRAYAAVSLAGLGARAAGLAPAAALRPARHAALRDAYRRWWRLHRAGLQHAGKGTEEGPEPDRRATTSQ